MGTVTRLQTGYEPPEMKAEPPLAVKWLADSAREHLKVLTEHDAETRLLLDLNGLNGQDPETRHLTHPPGFWDARSERRVYLVARALESARALLKVLP